MDIARERRDQAQGQTLSNRKDDSEERIEQQGATRLWWIPTPLDSPHDALREWELSHRTLIDLLPEDGDVAE